MLTPKKILMENIPTSGVGNDKIHTEPEAGKY